jgi:hypothetical protein
MVFEYSRSILPLRVGEMYNGARLRFGFHRGRLLPLPDKPGPTFVWWRFIYPESVHAHLPAV